MVGWFKRGQQKKEDRLLERLLEVMEQQSQASKLQQEQQGKMMERVIEMAISNQTMMREWFGMFKPPEGNSRSTSLEDREKMEQGEWEPLKLEDVVKEFVAEDKEYQERAMR